MAIILGIVLIAMAVGIGYVAYSSGIDTTEKALTFYEKDIKCFTDGSCIEISKPRKETVPVNYDTDDITEAQYYQNGTARETEQIVQDPEVETYYLGYDRPEIQGYIKILDSNGNLIEPTIYKWTLDISCDESMEWCNLNPPFHRNFYHPEEMTTDGGLDESGDKRGGYFYYKWTPPSDTLTGLYDVTISFTSTEQNQFGQYPTNSHSYQIQMVE